MGDSTFDVAIVGAGISGLTFAHHAARAQRRCLVLEQDTTVGGCIRTARGEGDFWYELGAHTLYNSYGALLDIVAELGLRGELIGRKQAPYRLLVDGKLRSVPSQLAKAELFRSLWRAFSLRKDGRSVGDYYGRLVGKQNWRRVVSPLLAAVPSQRADDFPAEMLFKRRPRRKEFPRTFTFTGGLQSLVDRLAGQPGITVRPRTAVTAVTGGPAGFTLTASDGTSHGARSLALAVPPDAAARLLAPLAPEASAALADIRTTAIDSTGVILEREALPLPRLAGLVPLDDDFFSAVSRDVVPHPRLRALAFHFRTGLTLDERRTRIATVTGVRPERLTTLAEHRSVLPSPVLGHAELVRAVDRHLAGSGVYLTGNYFGGLAIEDCVLRSAAEARRLLSERR